jgi:spore germination protein GerM
MRRPGEAVMPQRVRIMRMQNQRSVYKVWLTIIAAAMTMSLVASSGSSQPPAPGPQAGRSKEDAVNAEASPDDPAYLYFADAQNAFLIGEPKKLLPDNDPATHCRLLLEGLIQGPGGGGLIRTIPEGTRLRAVYVTSDETAYVDFTEEICTGHSGGVRSERMTVYSIVNTLVLNVSGVEQVKILIAGQEAETLAGHLDIRLPLKADMLLIR